MGGEIPPALVPLGRLLDEPRPAVLLVVGTGISIGSTADARASWKGLLLDGLQRLKTLGLARDHSILAQQRALARAFSHFELPTILDIAEFIIAGLGGTGDPEFARWLQDSVGALKSAPDRREALDGIAELSRAGALIFTTNYDSLLEEVTGYEPVTWEEPNKLLEVITRRRRGIIHIHGHWSRPSSVVLGRSAYERIIAAELAQTELKSLWLQWHWIYIGCGSGGLDDPNLGALLQWAHDANFGQSALADYFLSTKKVILALPTKVGKSANLVKYAYTNHTVHLPQLLRLFAPESRPFPFERIGPNARRVRRRDESPLSSPFPSWEEYASRAVPDLAADEEVVRRLEAHGWAFVFDDASTGKTTLTYRIAGRPEFVDHPTYYLSLSRLPIIEGETEASPQAAFARLARPATLFVIDDAHHEPELASMLWQQWRERPMGSKLILVGTKTDRPLTLPGDSSLGDLETHPHNPSVPVRVSTHDLARIAAYVLGRLGQELPITELPQDVLNDWHFAFSRELGAFVVAISQRRQNLAHGDYNLPQASAGLWIHERHLKRLNPNDLKNVMCLAVFAGQPFELDVPVQCLPHPTGADRLLRSGLAEPMVVRREPFIRYGLREPSWGKLLLESAAPQPSDLSPVVSAARENISFALAISGRLRRFGQERAWSTYWQMLAGYYIRYPHKITPKLSEVPLLHVHAFLNTAATTLQTHLVREVWRGIGAHPDALTERMLAAPLKELTWLLNAARQRNSDLSRALWRALYPHLGRLGGNVAEAHLAHITDFIELAAAQQEQAIVDRLAESMASRPDILLLRVFETSIYRLAIFISAIIALRKGHVIEQLWSLLEKHSDAFVEHARSSGLDALTGFLRITAEQKHRDFALTVWRAFVTRPQRLLDLASDTALKDISAFMEALGRDVPTTAASSFWGAVSNEPAWLRDRIVSAPFSDLSAFMHTVWRQAGPDLSARLWGRIARGADMIGDRVFETPLMDLSAFLNASAKLGGEEIGQRIWHMLSADPQRIAARCLSAPLSDLSAFLRTGAKQRQETFISELWTLLHAHRLAVVQRAFDAPLSDLAAFLETAVRQGQRTLASELWDAVVSEPSRFEQRILEAPLHGLSAFIRVAAKQSKTAVLHGTWSVLEREAVTIINRALNESLESFSALAIIANEQHQVGLLAKLWQMLRLEARLVAKHASGQRPSQVIRFLVMLPDDVKQDIVQYFQLSDWVYGEYRNQRFSTGAAGLAAEFARAGRDDLKSALVENILTRADPADFGDKRTALLEVSRMVSFTSRERQPLLAQFLHLMCTDKWLTGAYKFGSTPALAGALYRIASSQPAGIIKLFWHRELAFHLRKAWLNPQELGDRELSAAVQLLGVSELIGCPVEQNMLVRAPLERIGALPTLFQGPVDTPIQPWTRQLWLGLRVLASSRLGLLHVDRSILSETLRVWPEPADHEGDQSADIREQTAKRINTSMKMWLRTCTETLTGQLVACREKLWVLVGFPPDLRQAIAHRN